MKQAALVIIRLYQGTVSSYWPSRCRHVPSCSHYAREAIERYGFIKGGWLALRRLVRCLPMGSRGYDPVP